MAIEWITEATFSSRIDAIKFDSNAVSLVGHLKRSEIPALGFPPDQVDDSPYLWGASRWYGSVHGKDFCLDVFRATDAKAMQFGIVSQGDDTPVRRCVETFADVLQLLGELKITSVGTCDANATYLLVRNSDTWRGTTELIYGASDAEEVIALADLLLRNYRDSHLFVAKRVDRTPAVDGQRDAG